MDELEKLRIFQKAVRETIEPVVLGKITPQHAVNRLRWFIWGDDELFFNEERGMWMRK